MIRLSDDLEYVTIKQAARIMKVSEGRISQFISQGRLKFRKVLGRKLILRQDLTDFAHTRSLKPGPVTGSRNRKRKAAL